MKVKQRMKASGTQVRTLWSMQPWQCDTYYLMRGHHIHGLSASHSIGRTGSKWRRTRQLTCLQYIYVICLSRWSIIFHLMQNFFLGLFFKKIKKPQGLGFQSIQLASRDSNTFKDAEETFNLGQNLLQRMETTSIER